MWKENKLEKQIEFMLSNQYYFTFTSYVSIDANGELLNKKFVAQKQIDYKKLLLQNNIGCLTVIIDRNEIDSVRMPNLKHEDFATWLNILRRGYKAYGLDKTLAYYRKTEGSASANKLKTIKWVWNIYRRDQDLNLIYSIYLIINFIIRSLFKYVK